MWWIFCNTGAIYAAIGPLCDSSDPPNMKLNFASTVDIVKNSSITEYFI